MNRGNFYVVWVCTLLIVTGKGEVEVSECVWERERRDIDVQMYGKIEKTELCFPFPHLKCKGKKKLFQSVAFDT